jgi:BirA family biotin operon repressor/biotin-[acetyl-CoA-carboxylase] ligase
MSQPRETPLAQHVFAALADGRFHSGSELARAADVTRSAVWKAMQQLRALGVDVHAVSHRGYRLAEPAPPLDAARIAALLGIMAGGMNAGIDVEVAWSVESTNQALLAREPPAPQHVRVLLAEHQSAGRGRRGRRWHAPLGGALCFSLSAAFAELPPDASALSLAMGVCLLRALRRLGLAPAALKWPNDIVTAQGKLGGILIELRAEAAGPAHLVIGIGMNLRLDAATLAAVRASGTAAVDLRSLGAVPAARNDIAAALIGECAAGLREFARSGFHSFIDEWRAADVLRDRAVTASEATKALHGIARGIDARGALQLETLEGMQSVVAGEVTLRADA